MKKETRSFLLFLFALVVYSAAYLNGVASVPFHPDESTFLYLSSDLEILVHDPSSLAWRSDNVEDARQRYRLLDAPLGRMMVGIGRRLAGYDAPLEDWKWYKSWDENQRDGALPDQWLLTAGRMGLAALFPFSLLLFFLIVRCASNHLSAWIAAFLLGSNALILLHTRRAMSEGALLFTLLLTLYVFIKAEKRPWLIAIPAALAFSAKHSLAVLALISLIPIVWRSMDEAGWKRRVIAGIKNAAAFVLLYAVIIFLLNPFLWGQPIQAAKAAVQARQTLAAAQAGDQTVSSIATIERNAMGLIGAVYLTPPIYAEVSNYLGNTRAAEQAYQSNPLHNLFRSVTGGGIMLILGLFGFTYACLQITRRDAHPLEPQQVRALAILLAATFLQTIALIGLIPNPWQRYFLPVVPFSCFWAAYGIHCLIQPVLHQFAAKKVNRLPVSVDQ